MGDTPITFSAICHYYRKTTRHGSAPTSGDDNKPDNTLSNFNPAETWRGVFMKNMFISPTPTK
jgi:hypothetical protein